MTVSAVGWNISGGLSLMRGVAPRARPVWEIVFGNGSPARFLRVVAHALARASLLGYFLEEALEVDLSYQISSAFMNA